MNFWMTLSLLFSILSFSSASSTADEKNKEALLASLNTKIVNLEAQLEANPAAAQKNKLFKKLVSLHKKRIKLSSSEESARWAFIQDDLKWGTGAYAVPLLESLNASNEAKIRLMEVNSERAGKQIRTKVVGENKIKYFFKRLSGKNRYRFDEAKVDAWSHKLNKDDLTPDQLARVKAVDPVFDVAATPLAKETPKEEVSDPESSVAASSEDQKLEQDKQEAAKIAEDEVQKMKDEAAQVASQVASEQQVPPESPVPVSQESVKTESSPSGSDSSETSKKKENLKPLA